MIKHSLFQLDNSVGVRGSTTSQIHFQRMNTWSYPYPEAQIYSFTSPLWPKFSFHLSQKQHLRNCLHIQPKTLSSHEHAFCHYGLHEETWHQFSPSLIFTELGHVTFSITNMRFLKESQSHIPGVFPSHLQELRCLAMWIANWYTAKNCTFQK